MRLRSVLLVAALVSVLLLTATGTQSLSSAELERGLSVNVVSDDEAYLGYAAEGDENQTLTVELTNAFEDGQSLSVVVTVSNGSAPETKTASLAPGETQSLQFGSVSCDATIDVVATGQTTRIELSRLVSCGPTTDVTVE